MLNSTISHCPWEDRSLATGSGQFHTAKAHQRGEVKSPLADVRRSCPSLSQRSSQIPLPGAIPQKGFGSVAGAGHAPVAFAWLWCKEQGLRVPKGQCCCPRAQLPIIIDSLGLCHIQTPPDGAASPAWGLSATLLPFRSKVKGNTIQEGFLRAFLCEPLSQQGCLRNAASRLSHPAAFRSCWAQLLLFSIVTSMGSGGVSAQPFVEGGAVQALF